MSRRLALLAPAGVLLGHLLGYLLAGTGSYAEIPHGHLVVLGWPAGAVALGALVLAATRRKPSRTTLLGLAGLQAGAFLTLEALERGAAGIEVAATFHDPAVLAGLAAQVLAAAVLLLAERGSRRIGERLAAAFQPRPLKRVRSVPEMLPGDVDVLRPRMLAPSISRRGPPLALAR